MMDVVDKSAPVSDDDLQAAIVRLLALIDGLGGAHHHCPCGRLYRLGVSTEIEALTRKVRRAILERTGEDPTPDTSRFAMLEVD